MRRNMPLVGAVAGLSVLTVLFLTLEHRGPESQRRPTRTDGRVGRSSSVVPRVRPQGSTFYSAINDAGRNPFSFRPVRIVLRGPAEVDATAPRATRVSIRETPEVSPPAVAAPFKFMGVLQKGSGDTWAIFADCAGYTGAAREGESILGAWRVVRLSAELVVVESLKGQRVTMPLTGCGARPD